MNAAALLALGAALLVAPGPVGAPRRLRTLWGVRWPRLATTGDGTRRPDTGKRPPKDVPAARRPTVLVVAALTLVGAACGGVAGGVAGVAVGAGVGIALARRASRPGRARPDPLAEAGAWDQLAACLRAGLPLDRAVRAVAPLLPAAPAVALARVADLAALGADPIDAWAPALDEPGTARLARAARRSARSGAAIADVAVTVATDVRAEAADVVAARAERAGVLVTGPLGLCFLPAFLALGIVPVVVGLAGPLLAQR